MVRKETPLCEPKYCIDFHGKESSSKDGMRKMTMWLCYHCEEWHGANAVRDHE